MIVFAIDSLWSPRPEREDVCRGPRRILGLWYLSVLLWTSLQLLFLRFLISSISTVGFHGVFITTQLTHIILCDVVLELSRYHPFIRIPYHSGLSPG